MPNYKLTLQYDGSRYRGWQRLPNTELTIQGKLEAVLSRIFDAPVAVSGSGRTDAGVHALGQVASFRTAALRQYLPADVGAVRLEYAPPRFHARLSAVSKTYRYRVWNSDEPCVFERRWVYVFPDALDLGRMRQAAEKLLLTHDFRAFSADRSKKSTVRTLTAVQIERVGPEVRFTLTGDGFLHHICTTWCASSSGPCLRSAGETGTPAASMRCLRASAARKPASRSRRRDFV